MEFSKLARELEIPEDLLETVLDDAARLLRQSPASVRPANKKALRGVAKGLAGTIGRISKTEVRERLVAAAFEEPEDPDEDGLAHYTAWSNAKHRVDRAIEGARDLLAVVECGEAINRRSGRPQYDHCVVAIRSLLGFWTEDLHREVTISGHAADGRKVKPSPALRFVHQSMHLIGEEITEQACSTILRNLRPEFEISGARP